MENSTDTVGGSLRLNCYQILDGNLGCEELEMGEKPKVFITPENVHGEWKHIAVEDD